MAVEFRAREGGRVGSWDGVVTSGRPLTAEPQHLVPLLLVQGLTRPWPCPDHIVIFAGFLTALPTCFETSCSLNMWSPPQSLKPAVTEFDHMNSPAPWCPATDLLPFGAWCPMLSALLVKTGLLFRHLLFELQGRVRLLVSYIHSTIPTWPACRSRRWDRSLLCHCFGWTHRSNTSPKAAAYAHAWFDSPLHAHQRPHR